MYEKCLECKKLGNPCDGPNFMAMNTEDLIHWCNERKKQLPGLTYDRIVEKTGLSKGTISGFFTGSHTDYRIETIRPILKLLIGGEWEDSPCGDPTAEERAHTEEKFRQLEEGIAWRDERIQHLTNNYNDLTTLVANTNKRNAEQVEFLRKQLDERYQFLKRKDKIIVTLSVLLGLCVLLIIAALIIDRTNSGVGFFWLESLFKPNGINEILQKWRT